MLTKSKLKQNFIKIKKTSSSNDELNISPESFITDKKITTILATSATLATSANSANSATSTTSLLINNKNNHLENDSIIDSIIDSNINSNINSNIDSDTNSDDDSDSESDDNRINTQITTKSVLSVFNEYLQDGSLLLQPEYQRDLCWSIDKMNAFIDTVMKGWIVPNYVIYQLSSKELKSNEHSYECIDGQHRLKTLQLFIKGDPYPGTLNKYVCWKNGKERVFYDMPEQFIKGKIQSSKKSKHMCRNLTKEEKVKFNKFQMSFHMIDKTNGLSIGLKCDIFNRLQNGEKMSSYEKLKNLHSNIITDCIRSKKLMTKMKENNFFEKINFGFKKSSGKKPEAFNIYFAIRAFLIIDKKSLQINYLDLNIKKYLEANNGKGLPIVQLSNDINELYENVCEITDFLASLTFGNLIIPELAYIFVCIYANYGINELRKVIQWMCENPNNDKHFVKLNDLKTYKTGHDKVTSAEKITEQYNNLVKFILKKNINIETNTNIKQILDV